MTQPAAMTSAHGTGDINLASALMAMGIAPDEQNPCSIISKDDGRDYGRFFIGPISNCGKFETMKLLRYWSYPAEIPNQSHPFGWILDFIAKRPQGCSTPGDWLDYAHDHLAVSGELPAGFPRNLDHIPDIVARAPEAKASYILAFTHCRLLCVQLVKNARRQVMMRSRDGRSAQVIDARLPRSIRNNLIARLEG